MFRLGKYTRSFLRIVFYSIGLTIFLSEGWIVPKGDMFLNVIAGIVLYLAAWFAALIVSSLINSQTGKA
jgi:cadmium resistance protein CadD (predicted permease)